MTRGGQINILYTLFALLFATFCTMANGEDVKFQASHLARFATIENNLPNNFVDDILKDSQGYVWVATSGGGLSRYDGYDFLTFSSNSTVRLKDNFIRNLAEDSFGRLWIGSEGGIDILDLESLKTVTFGNEDFVPYTLKFCSYLASDATGAIWCAIGPEIVRISFDGDGEIASVSSIVNEGIVERNLVMEDVSEDGSIWCCIKGKICRISVKEDGSLTVSEQFPEFSLREEAYVSDFLIKENELWISTNDGLFRYNMNASRWKHYEHSPANPNSLSQNFISGLAVTEDKQLVAASLKGMNIYDPIDDSFERIGASSASGQALLSSEFINCIRVYGRQIWVGTESAGLAIIMPKQLSIENISNSKGQANTIAPNPVNAIYEDSLGRLWIGTVESGLSCSSPDEWTGFRHFTAESIGLSHNSISAITSDLNGDLWVGTWGGGINRISTSRTFKVVQRIDADPNGVDPMSFVGALAMDEVNNILWIGANSGIYYYDIENGEVHAAMKEQATGVVGACIDASGRLWMGGQKGLVIFDLTSRTDAGFAYIQYSYKLDAPESMAGEKIACITEASDGTIWVGSNGNGIYKVEINDNGNVYFRNYGHKEGLVNDGVRGILEDNEGNLWISTCNGLSYFNPETERFSSFTVSDGLANNQFYWNAAMKRYDGSLCFGHVDGLSVVHPETSVDINIAGDLRFTRFTVGSKIDNNPDTELIRLHERDRNITLEFASMTFLPESSISYTYYLDGMDENWVDLPDHRHFISYPSFRHGKYRLTVKAMDEAGNEMGSRSVDISVRPYYYHSWWFYLLILCFATTILFIYQKHRERLFIRQKEELKRQVEERTEEITGQKKLLEEKAEELAIQNRTLMRQNEELAGHKILFAQESRGEDAKVDKFVAKALEVVREHYKDPDLDIAAFCEAMGISKTLLNRKMQEAFGQSTGQFIRTYRLSIAREMLINNLEKKTMNISEIAYEVGFNDPKYFTRCFAKEFGVSPSSFPEM